MNMTCFCKVWGVCVNVLLILGGVSIALSNDLNAATSDSSNLQYGPASNDKITTIRESHNQFDLKTGSVIDTLEYLFGFLHPLNESIDTPRLGDILLQNEKSTAEDAINDLIRRSTLQCNDVIFVVQHRTNVQVGDRRKRFEVTGALFGLWKPIRRHGGAVFYSGSGEPLVLDAGRMRTRELTGARALNSGFSERAEARMSSPGIEIQFSHELGSVSRSSEWVYEKDVRLPGAYGSGRTRWARIQGVGFNAVKVDQLWLAYGALPLDHWEYLGIPSDCEELLSLVFPYETEGLLELESENDLFAEIQKTYAEEVERRTVQCPGNNSLLTIRKNGPNWVTVSQSMKPRYFEMGEGFVPLEDKKPSATPLYVTFRKEPSDENRNFRLAPGTIRDISDSCRESARCSLTDEDALNGTRAIVRFSISSENTESVRNIILMMDDEEVADVSRWSNGGNTVSPAYLAEFGWRAPGAGRSIDDPWTRIGEPISKIGEVSRVRKFLCSIDADGMPEWDILRSPNNVESA